MNTPNKLTLLRIGMAPVFLILLLVDFPFHSLFALLVFSVAALTDLFDGRLARKNNQITDFGKFLDPLADKMLMVKMMENGGAGFASISQKIKTSSYVAEKYSMSARKFSLARLKRLCAMCSELDLAIKEGELSDWEAVENYMTGFLL